MILKTNPYPAELLLRLSGVNGYKPIHPRDGTWIAELIKDYYNQISNLVQAILQYRNDSLQL